MKIFYHIENTVPIEINVFYNRVFFSLYAMNSVIYLESRRFENLFVICVQIKLYSAVILVLANM